MNMVKVFVYCPNALERGRGGEISTMEVVKGLSKHYEITFTHTSKHIRNGLLTTKAIKEKLENVNIKTRIKFATFTLRNKHISFPYPLELLKLYKLIKNHDIVYASSCSTIKDNFMLIILSLLRRNAKFIISYRAPLYSERNLSLYNLKYRISILLLSRFKKRFYHHTLSQHAKRFLNNFYQSRKVIHIIHGIELESFTDDGMMKKQNDVLKFIYVGNIDDVHKGVDVLIEGIQKFIKENRNLKVFFEFCGEGPLESRVIKLQNDFPEYVRYNGYISNDRIPEYYKRSDVFLFTSRREPFGRVIIEALASNLLIICTKTYGSIEILKQKKFAFFLRDLNVDAITEKIYSVYKLWKEKRSEFIELQEKAKIYALQNYSIIKEIEMFKDLFNNIIKIG